MLQIELVPELRIPVDYPPLLYFLKLSFKYFALYPPPPPSLLRYFHLGCVFPKCAYPHACKFLKKGFDGEAQIDKSIHPYAVSLK